MKLLSSSICLSLLLISRYALGYVQIPKAQPDNSDKVKIYRGLKLSIEDKKDEWYGNASTVVKITTEAGAAITGCTKCEQEANGYKTFAEITRNMKDLKTAADEIANDIELQAKNKADEEKKKLEAEKLKAEEEKARIANCESGDDEKDLTCAVKKLKSGKLKKEDRESIEERFNDLISAQLEDPKTVEKAMATIKSLKNKYQQERRWSWGVSDDPLFIKWWFTVPNVPFIKKTKILYHVLLDHFMWPVNWFILTIFANIITLINPVFARTSLGYNLPVIARFILSSTIVALIVMIIIDYRNRPKNLSKSKVREILFPLEFVLMPIVGFFLNALPAIISHTQIMLGRKMEYKVTEKI